MNRKCRRTVKPHAFALSVGMSLCAAFFGCSSSSSTGSDQLGGAGSSGQASSAGGALTSAGSAGLSGGRALGVGGTKAGGSGGTADVGGASNTGGAQSLGGALDMGGMPSAGGAPGMGGMPNMAGGGHGGGGAPGMGGSAGSAGATTLASYMIGADITSVQAAEARGATYSDGTKQDIFQLLKSHGFNYIRLRTFVNPKAADGYDKQNGYADLAHTITFGKRIKSAGLGLLLDFHYSDNWADPGKQCVPVAWQAYTTIDQLATAVHDYTKDAITQLIAGGARPDMVQIGNEITPGMLLHICDANGQPTGNNPVAGSISNWANLGALLKAGAKGVRDVDAGIKIMIHIDRGGDKGGYTGGAQSTSASFITNAQKQGVVFDIFGESCYQAYQGDTASTANTKTDWNSTFTGLASKFPTLQFVAAEYGPMQREINDVIFGLPNRQGLGTFNWEPSEQGDWNTGHALFTAAGNAYTSTTDLTLYDAMKTAYGSRL